jgi:quinol monooxygenase YgiN
MPKQTVYFVVELVIDEKKSAEFESVSLAMIAGSRKESGCLGYDWFLSGDGKRCRLVENYADTNAVLAHLMGPVVQELVPMLLRSSSISRFEVYGDPGPKAAEILSGVGAEIFPLWKAFGN